MQQQKQSADLSEESVAEYNVDEEGYLVDEEGNYLVD